MRLPACLWLHLPLLASASTSPEDELASRYQEFIEEFDANHDGKLSLEELQGMPDDGLDDDVRESFSRNLKKADEDGDGAISIKELPRFVQEVEDEKRKQPSGKQSEFNGEDFKAKGYDDTFNKLDTSSDGQLSYAELNAVGDELKGEEAEQYAQMFRKADKSGDGTLSREEFQGFLEEGMRQVEEERAKADKQEL